jgi:hypothetical protein
VALNSNTTSVSGAASSTALLGVNGARVGASVHNDSTAILYLLLGTGTASSSNYTVQMAANSHYEVPFGYCGPLTGIWASATGAARLTEYN